MIAATLGLRVQERAHAWLACGALFIAYVATMARDISLYDSPELTIAAAVLGLGHPPGQPLHTLLGYVLSRLPVSVPIGVGLASALPGALCVIPATAIAEQLAGDGLAPRIRRALPWGLAAMGLLPPLWEPATRVEVYALATFFGLWALARLSPLQYASRDVFLAGLGLGLCASANPMIAFLIGVAVGPSILVRLVRRALPLRAVPSAIAGGLLGLVPYGYVLLVARRTDVFVWGAPRDAASMRAFFLLADYDPNHQLTLPMWIGHFVRYLPYAAERGLIAVIAVGIAAHALLGRRTALSWWTAPLMLALMIGQISFNVMWSLDVPDYDGYLAVALWLLAAGTIAGSAQLHARSRPALGASLAALVVLSAWLAPPAVFARTRYRDHVARTLAERVLAEAPRDAIVISLMDLYSASLLYLQEVEHQRPDVVVLAHGLASSSWFWEHIYRRHPQLAAFPLRGPGGRNARIGRFLAANPQRQVNVEQLEIVEQLGLRACRGGLYLRTGAACDEAQPTPALPSAHALLAQQLAAVGDGSPSADGALADVSFHLGYALWRVGEPDAAYATLLAGVPDALEPRSAAGIHGLAGVSPAAARVPAWRRTAALGEPARNLFLAGSLAASAGKLDVASALIGAAASLGLPEALDLVSGPR